MCTIRTWKKYEREEEGRKGRKETHLMENPWAPSKVGQWLPDDVKEQGAL